MVKIFGLPELSFSHQNTRTSGAGLFHATFGNATKSPKSLSRTPSSPRTLTRCPWSHSFFGRSSVVSAKKDFLNRRRNFWSPPCLVAAAVLEVLPDQRWILNRRHILQINRANKAYLRQCLKTLRASTTGIPSVAPRPYTPCRTPGPVFLENPFHTASYYLGRRSHSPARFWPSQGFRGIRHRTRSSFQV